MSIALYNAKRKGLTTTSGESISSLDLKKPKSKSKMNNTKVVYNGITFDSKKERDRYKLLVILQRQEVISMLSLQVRYKLIVNGQLICTYVADFVYTKNDQIVVEDCKGFRTPVYLLKRKLMKAIHGIDILET